MLPQNMMSVHAGSPTIHVKTDNFSPLLELGDGPLPPTGGTES
jgi:hypothetical protein